MSQKLLEETNTKKLEEWQTLLKGNNNLLAEELWDSPKAFLLSKAQNITKKNILILNGGSEEENRLFHDFPFFSDNSVLELPAWEALPNENIAPSPDVVGERYTILNTIASAKKPLIILSSLQAALQKLISPKWLSALNLTIKTGKDYNFKNLIDKLSSMGYIRSTVASDKGEFAVRGGIIDIFPVGLPDAFRIEFWDNTIESIRIYDPVGQKSIRPVQEVSLTPAQELELLHEQENLCTLFDYLGDNTLIVFNDLLALEDRYADLVGMLGKPSQFFCSLEELLENTETLQKIFFSTQPIEELSRIDVLEGSSGGFYSATASSQAIRFTMFEKSLEAKRWLSPFCPVEHYLSSEGESLSGDDLLLRFAALKKDHKIHFLCNSDSEEKHLQQQFSDANIVLPKETVWHRGYLSTGFVYQENLVVPHTEFTHRYKLRRQKLRSTYHTSPVETFDIVPGEALVHLNNGIGKFLGVERRTDHNNIEREFFHIEYADKASLFVPMHQAHMINKYIGSSDKTPSLSKLGSNRWRRTRETTERAIIGYASELLDSYARREVKGGFSFPSDTEEMLSFEDEFPFIETEDQVAAIANIKEDMILESAMDRLVCGDVGYGKTEVAMRAAFKAVVDGGKQVAMLVPTTVLAMQHYDSFCERMRNFPVNVALLSRMASTKATKETLEGLSKGSIDIVIGTHRIVSKDIHFKNLGLTIIDEEQRFGVRAKEHLKKLKTGVDCLTLSATPIPRTLYMALLGARDMSVINTPPQDRLPISSMIAAPTDQVLKNALLRELARDGQVFFIHNRVETIFEAANRIKKLLPKARVLVGHGQMSAEELDSIFHAFKRGDADILVATTIIENGVDIPNANTILIDRSDRFGMAELYQLRGRVGRWNRKAYCYFLVPHGRPPTEIAHQRLSALVELSGYGGGMKVAMRDLELRGAGDLLGTEQSGHVSAIGFHLYCKMLKRTIHALQGNLPAALVDTKLEIAVDARLPDDYINEPMLRMEIYHRLGEALSWDDVDTIWHEVKDRFGKAPLPAQWLYHLTKVRVFAARHGFSLVKMEKISLSIERKKGKEITTHRVPCPKPRKPQELEVFIIKALKTLL